MTSYPERHDPTLAAAAILSIAFVVLPTLYYALFDNRRLFRRSLVFSAVFLAISQVFSPDSLASFWQEYRWIKFALVLPAGLLAFRSTVRIALAIGRHTQAVDAEQRIRSAVDAHVRDGLFRSVMTSELLMLYFSLLSWGNPSASTTHGGGRSSFSYARHDGLAGSWTGICGLVVLDIVTSHLVIWLFSARAAWIVTALGGYGLLWFLANLQAIRQRATVLTDDHLYARCGLLQSLNIPLSVVENARIAPRSEYAQQASVARVYLAPFVSANVEITLCQPYVVARPIGRDKTILSVILALDRPKMFIDALHHRLHADSPEHATTPCTHVSAP